MIGAVHLVGAGSGPADLITVRGRRLIEHCGALVYDALIDPSLLELAPAGAELICVGKRSGRHSVPQEETNALLIKLALEGRNVVRLKGGDPFVFGRGGEEILALQERGIPYSLTPGISSAIAVPEGAGIPVTHRLMSRSFHVITAHTAGDGPDFGQYAGLGGTLVFLMGRSKLGRISRELIGAGMSPETPAAVISRGGSEREECVRGRLSDIPEKAAALEAPAVIVVGETAGLDLGPRPRATVTVTGTERFQLRVAELLRVRGLGVRGEPPVRLRPIAFDLPDLNGYGCIVLTSVNGARIFLEKLRAEETDLRRLAGLSIAVIGSETAGYLAERGLYADLCPGSFNSAALARLIAERLPRDRRVLILRAENGARALTDILAEEGFGFDDIPTYRVEGGGGSGPVRTDYIVFGSGSGARTFFEGGGRLGPGTKAVCIGTAAAAGFRKYSDQTCLTARVSTAGGIADIILEDLT